MRLKSFLLTFLGVISLAQASYNCVGEKFQFSTQKTENENEYMGSIISLHGQLLMRVIMNEGTLTKNDRRQFKTAFTGANSQEKFTLYVGKNKNISYLNIERNLGGNSTYELSCVKNNN